MLRVNDTGQKQLTQHFISKGKAVWTAVSNKSILAQKQDLCDLICFSKELPSKKSYIEEIWGELFQ